MATGKGSLRSLTSSLRWLMIPAEDRSNPKELNGDEYECRGSPQHHVKSGLSCGQVRHVDLASQNAIGV
jgi:hypothetical protein